MSCAPKRRRFDSASEARPRSTKRCCASVNTSMTLRTSSAGRCTDLQRALTDVRDEALLQPRQRLRCTGHRRLRHRLARGGAHDPALDLLGDQRQCLDEPCAKGACTGFVRRKDVHPERDAAIVAGIDERVQPADRDRGAGSRPRGRTASRGTRSSTAESAPGSPSAVKFRRCAMHSGPRAQGATAIARWALHR